MKQCCSQEAKAMPVGRNVINGECFFTQQFLPLEQMLSLGPVEELK